MMRPFNHIAQWGMFAIVSAALYACQGTAAPTRKKMPEFTETAGFEGPLPFEQSSSGYAAEAYAFQTSSVDLMVDGQVQGFVKIPLPDATNDSLAIQMLTSFKPFAVPLLTNWAQQERHGVLLDLSAHQGQTIQRSDFELKIPGNAIPVVVMWDAASAYRLLTLKQLAQDVPAIQFKQKN